MTKKRSLWLSLVVSLLACLSLTHGQGLPAAQIDWPEGESTITIPFAYDRGFIMIPVSVMGSKPLQLILDSGAPLMVLPDEAFAETLDLNIVTQVPVGGTGDGKPKTAPLAMGVNATVGGLKITKGNLLVGAAKEVLQGFDGVIGASVFGNCIVEIDWSENELHLHDPATFKYAGKGAVLDLTVAANGHPYVDGFSARFGESEWIDLKLHLDSGFRGALTLDPDSHEAIAVPENAAETIIAWGSRGPARGFMGRIDALRVGDSELTALPTSFSKSASAGAPGAPTNNGSLGLFVLERFHTLIDYPGGRLILEPTERTADVFSTNTTGIRLAPWTVGTETLTIAAVMSGSPAAQLGLKEGDSVTSVNGAGVDKLKYGEIFGLWRSAPGTQLKLAIERDGKAMQLSLTSAVFM